MMGCQHWVSIVVPGSVRKALLGRKLFLYQTRPSIHLAQYCGLPVARQGFCQEFFLYLAVSLIYCMHKCALPLSNNSSSYLTRSS